MFVEVGLFEASYNQGNALVGVADTFLDMVECLKHLKLVVSFTWKVGSFGKILVLFHKVFLKILVDLQISFFHLYSHLLGTFFQYG